VGKRSTGQRILHLDAFSGAAGNMFLGALLDVGLSRKALLEGLAPLDLDFKLVVKKVQRSAFAARYVDVQLPGGSPKGRARKVQPKASPHAHAHVHRHDDVAHAHGRSYAQISRLISKSGLDSRVRARSLEIFEALGRAEAKVHGTKLEAVHFHEVGAVDAIVDVVGAAVALDVLAIERVTCTPIAIGHGTIDSDHGLLPLPAPATIELLAGIPTVPAAVEWETLTPTGAAILRTIVDEFGWMPAMTIEKIGYGAGNDRKGHLPNVLRAVLGRGSGLSGDRVVCIETNLDDLVPEHFDYLMERLFEAGALDVSLQHLQMKKNRPGFLLRVLARPSEREELARIVFAESTAIGVRLSEWDRLVLERKQVRLDTSFGKIGVKRITGADGAVTYSPEYEDCKRAARKTGRPLREIVRAVTELAGRGSSQ
jgi:pyridinium-3,5-bisthiocarboxylic acid mononucleotide nickel chelatase